MDEKERFLNAFEENNDAMFRHCVLRVSDREIALDLVQDAFANTWNYIVSGNDEIKNMRAFLYRTLNNSIIDYYRKKKESSLEAIAEDGNPDFLPGMQVDDTDRWVDVIDGSELIERLKDLPDIYTQALTLRFVDGFTPIEIAEIIGESQNVVSVRIHRGIQKLRDLTTHS